MLKLRYLFCVIILCSASISFSQSVDAQFDASITGFSTIYSVDTTSDGRIIIAGSISKVDNHKVNLEFENTVVIIKSDGSLDENFILDNEIRKFSLRGAFETSEGDIAITTSLADGANGLYLVDISGNLKEDFQLDDHINRVSVVAKTSNDFFIIAGTQTGRELLKIDETGVIDESFGRHTIDGGDILLPGEDGDVIVVGGSQAFEGTEQGIAYKVLSNGTLDGSFDSGSQETIQVMGAIRQNDDKIFLYGTFTSFQGISTPSSYFRLNSDGSLDENFDLTIGQNFVSYNPSFLSEAIQDSEGNYYIAGCTYTNSGISTIIYSLAESGSTNFQFNPIFLKNNYGGCNLYIKIVIANDNLIYAGGDFSYEADGTYYQGFVAFDETGTTTGLNPELSYAANEITAGFNYRENKPIVAGKFTAANSTRVTNIVRLNSNGTTDETFNPDFNLADYSNSYIGAIDTTSGGKILIGGIMAISGEVRALSRLNPDGTLDNSFSTQLYAPGTGIRVMKKYGDGKFMVGGTKLQDINNSNLSGHLAIINEDGSVEKYIELLDNEQDQVRDLEILEDGSVIVAGVKNDSRGFVYKISPDGSISSDFTSHPDLDLGIYAIGLLEDRLVLGGYLNIGGSPEEEDIPILQLSLTGEIIDSDLIVTNGRGNNFSIVFDIQTTDDGDIILGGLFSKVNGFPIENLAKVSTDGTIDSEFIFDFGYGFAQKIVPTAEEYLFVLGRFAKMNNSQNIGIARVKTTNTAPHIIGLSAELETDEETSMTISIDDFNIEDIDDDLEETSIRISEGENFTFDGLTITPVIDFNGTLSIPVIANDGKNDSEPFNISVEVLPVNDVPVVVSQTTDVEVDEEGSISLTITDFEVDDPDNTFPNDHTLEVLEGENYTFDGNTITPAVDFNGELAVNIRVNDSEEGESFAATVTVNPVNDAPVIIAQAGTLITDMETPLTITLSDLTVEDPDNSYPDDFTLTLSEGDDYTLDGNTITAIEDFFGSITVPAIVNDGELNSESFNLTITINPVASIDLEKLSKRFRVFPNPAQEKTIVEMENELYEPVKIMLYNSDGRMIDLGSFPKTSSEFSKELNLLGLTPGVYSIKISQGIRYSSSKKIIIKK